MATNTERWRTTGIKSDHWYGSKLVFTTTDGLPIPAPTLGAQWRDLRERVGLGKLCFQSTRACRCCWRMEWRCTSCGKSPTIPTLQSRLPATLQPAGSPQATTVPSSAPTTPVESVQAGHAVEAVRQDADVAPLVHQGRPGGVRPDGAGLGQPGRARQTILARTHPSRGHGHLLGRSRRGPPQHRRCPSQDPPLPPVHHRPSRPATTGGRPAGPSPLPPAQPGAALEVDRTVSLGGLVSLGPYRLLAAEILAGRRISIRIEAATLMFFHPDTRTSTKPVRSYKAHHPHTPTPKTKRRQEHDPPAHRRTGGAVCGPAPPALRCYASLTRPPAPWSHCRPCGSDRRPHPRGDQC